MLSYYLALVELLGAYSNLGHLSKKWSDLRKSINESQSRPNLSGQDSRIIRSKRFLTSADVTEIAHHYEAGETTQQIADRYDISKTRVATVLRERGVTIRRQGLTTEQVTEAAALYATGQSLAQIGARFSVSHTTVAATFRRQGVKLRGRPGWG